MKEKTRNRFQAFEVEISNTVVQNRIFGLEYYLQWIRWKTKSLIEKA